MNKKLKNVPPWVFGFKNEVSTSDWYRDLAFVILGKFDGIPRRPATISAESGFEIVPSWYSYIGRAEVIYGNGIFFFQVGTSNWESDDRGVCPFDSGGIWWGHIETNPKLPDNNQKKKKAFFEEYEIPLNKWFDSFRKYIVKNYSDYSKYVKGDPPDIHHGIESIIKTTPPNTDLAWTWEGRVAKDKAASKLKVAGLYCSEEKQIHIMRGISDLDSLILKEKETALRWVKSSTIWCEITESPVSKASQDIISKGLEHA